MIQTPEFRDLASTEIKYSKTSINILKFACCGWNNFDIFKAEHMETAEKLYIIGDGSSSILVYCLKTSRAIGSPKPLRAANPQTGWAATRGPFTASRSSISGASNCSCRATRREK